MSDEKPAYQDLGYVWGQLLATRTLLFAFAELAAAKPELHEAGALALQRLRDNLLQTPVEESTLLAVDDVRTVLDKRLM